MTEKIARKLINAVLQNAYTTDSIGFSTGKAGIALTLFESARFFKDVSIEDHAFDLFQEVLAYDFKDNGFFNGKAGIDFSLQYLIRNQLLNVDDDLFFTQHQEVIDTIRKVPYNEQGMLRYLDDYFYLETSALDSPGIRKTRQSVLVSYMLDIFRKIGRETVPKNAGTFYRLSSGMLSMLNSVEHTGKTDLLFDQISEIHEKMVLADSIIDYPLFPLHYYLYELTGNRNTSPDQGKKMIRECMKNLVYDTFGFRQRIDMVISIYRVYSFDRSMDYRDDAGRIIDTITDQETDRLEKKIVPLIRTNDGLDFSIGSGISRLLLLYIYWDEINRGVFPPHLMELLH
ncbi:MAG: hypothetical protein LBQ60_00635 [Bacteroidales bacterium]|nr:hypothetical protein [Bacteroidales bacterium]